MCIGVNYNHASCNHNRKFEVLEPCLKALNDQVCDTLIVVHTVPIYAPSLCIHCFRREEDEIFKTYKVQTMDVEDDIVKINSRLEDPELGFEERGRLVFARYLCGEKIGDLKDERNATIAGFREEQGVWRDGQPYTMLADGKWVRILGPAFE